MDLYEVFDIKIVVLESSLHEDVNKYSCYRDSENFTKEQSIFRPLCSKTGLGFVSLLVPCFVKQVFEVSRYAV
jgi:hypothetical protein